MDDNNRVDESIRPLMLPEILTRKSHFAFDSRPVEDDNIRLLLEAARWSPSSNNNQPWRLIAVSSAENLALVHEALNLGNSWGKAAPLIMVIAANPEDDDTIVGRPYYMFDCGIAAAAVMLQAVHLGLWVHPIAGWKESLVRKAVDLPEEMRVTVLIMIGYPGDIESLDEWSLPKERAENIRKPISDVAFTDSFRNPYK